VDSLEKQNTHPGARVGTGNGKSKEVEKLVQARQDVVGQFDYAFPAHVFGEGVEASRQTRLLDLHIAKAIPDDKALPN